MSGLITTGSASALLKPGLRKVFGLSYSEYKPEYPSIFTTMIKSDKKFEEYLLMSGLTMATLKAEGVGGAYDTKAQSYAVRINNVTYFSGFMISREAIEDNQYDSMALQETKSLARAVHLAKETVGANVLNRAFNSSYKQIGGDQLELCSTAHVSPFGSWNNELDTAANLSELALEQALIDISDYRDERGNRINVQGMKLIVPKERRHDASRILNSDLRVGTANNDLNSIKYLGLIPKGAEVNHFLSSAQAWFIITDCPNGMIWQDRRDPEFDSDNVFDAENVKFKVSARFQAGWADPRGIFGSPGV